MEIYASLENHLELPRGLFSIENPLTGEKLVKDWAKNGKYNWSKQDIFRVAPDLRTFFKDYVKSQGFGDGSMLVLRLDTVTSTKIVNSIELKEKDAPAAMASPQPQKTTQFNMENQITDNAKQHQQQPQGQVANAALGFTQVPAHEYISLKVLQERYIDLSDKLRKAEKELDEAQSDLRKAKEDNAALERKYELQEEKHNLAVERIENNRKSFMDTESGKKVIEGLAGTLPIIAEGLMNKQNQSQGLANPLQQFSPAQQEFIKLVLVNASDEQLSLLAQTYTVFANSEQFADDLKTQVENLLGMMQHNES